MNIAWTLSGYFLITALIIWLGVRSELKVNMTKTGGKQVDIAASKQLIRVWMEVAMFSCLIISAVLDFRAKTLQQADAYSSTMIILLIAMYLSGWVIVILIEPILLLAGKVYHFNITFSVT